MHEINFDLFKPIYTFTYQIKILWRLYPTNPPPTFCPQSWKSWQKPWTYNVWNTKCFLFLEKGGKGPSPGTTTVVNLYFLCSRIKLTLDSLHIAHILVGYVQCVSLILFFNMYSIYIVLYRCFEANSDATFR